MFILIIIFSLRIATLKGKESLFEFCSEYHYEKEFIFKGIKIFISIFIFAFLCVLTLGKL